MTDEQKAAFIIAQAACAQAEIAAMQAFNQHRLSLGQSIGYDEEAFLAIADKYLIGHNAVISFFQRRVRSRRLSRNKSIRTSKRTQSHSRSPRMSPDHTPEKE